MKIDKLITSLQKLKENGYTGSVDIFSESKQEVSRIIEVEYLHDMWAIDTQGVFLIIED